MQMVPVVSASGKPLMPCHPARARELVNKGRAIRRFNRGFYYIKLLDRTDGVLQPIAVGIDPGSKKEAFTVKSEKYTYLNIQVDAVTWVKKHIEKRASARSDRRYRKTPYRKHKTNRSGNNGSLPPSTKARWQWKLRVSKLINNLFPVSCFVVEDVQAITKKNQTKWNKPFSAVQNGKNWFYAELSKLARLELRTGIENSDLRKSLGLKKLSDKLSNDFHAHCVDSWLMANWYVGGHTEPDNKKIIYLVPLQIHRRQLHRMTFCKGGKRQRYGGTRSHGFKKGSWVWHLRFGLCYVGGWRKHWISLHDQRTGKLLSANINPKDCKFLCFSSWRKIIH